MIIRIPEIVKCCQKMVDNIRVDRYTTSGCYNFTLFKSSRTPDLRFCPFCGKEIKIE